MSHLLPYPPPYYVPNIFASAADNATNIASSMTAASASGLPLAILSRGNYSFSTAISVPVSLVIDGNMASVNQTVNISSSNFIYDIRSTANIGIASTQTSVANATIENFVSVVGGGVGNAISLVTAGSTMADITVRGCTTATGNYGVVLGTGTGTRLKITDSTIHTVNADSIEYNFPGGGSLFGLVTNCFLRNSGTGGAGTAGFSFGTAGFEAICVSSIVCEDSQFEAVHLEDVQKNNTIGPSIWYTRSHGLKIGNMAGNSPLPVTGNVFVSKTASTNTGIFLFSDMNGTVSGMSISSCRAVGFANGIDCGAALGSNPAVITMLSNSVFDSCTNAVAATGGAYIGECRQFGTNYATGATNLFALNTGGGHFAFGKVVADTAPTTVMLPPSGGYSGNMPSCCDGFAYPLSQIITVNGTVQRTVFTLPAASSTMNGMLKIRVRQSGVANWFYLTAWVNYSSGTWTFPADQVSTNSGGVITSVSLIGSGHSINVSIVATAVVTLALNYIEFDGDMWDA